MKRVLTVAYFYPPYDSTAGIEASKMTKYLREYGWDPIVVAAHNDFPSALPIEIDADRVYRTDQIDVNRLPKMVAGQERVTQRGYVVQAPGRLGRLVALAGLGYRHTVNFPDAQVGWYPFAVRTARRLIEEWRPDALLSIAWPVTCHLVASRLKRETGLPWFADFRDLWTDNHHFQRVRGLAGLERRLERRVMRSVDAVSTPSEDWSRHVARLYGVPSYTVPNGFEATDYPAAAETPDRFTLTYTGVLYPGSQDARPLLTAMSRLKGDGIIDAGNFRLRLVGRYLEQLMPLLERFDVRELTDITPTVPHKEALEIQKSSTALLFLLWTKPSGIGWYSAKAYEYLGARRPVLAIGPPRGAAADLIGSIDGCVVTDEVDTIEKTLRAWIDDFRSTEGVGPLEDPSIARFEWRNATKDLADGLDHIASRK